VQDSEWIRYISIRAAKLFSKPTAPHSATPELLQLLNSDPLFSAPQFFCDL
jgi:hypothetical protein